MAVLSAVYIKTLSAIGIIELAVVGSWVSVCQLKCTWKDMKLKWPTCFPTI